MLGRPGKLHNVPGPMASPRVLCMYHYPVGSGVRNWDMLACGPQAAASTYSYCFAATAPFVFLQCHDGVFAALAVHLAHASPVEWWPNTVWAPHAVESLSLKVRRAPTALQPHLNRNQLLIWAKPCT
jgi:hypothetical protein